MVVQMHRDHQEDVLLAAMMVIVGQHNLAALVDQVVKVSAKSNLMENFVI